MLKTLASILKQTDYKPDETPLVTSGDWWYNIKLFFGYVDAELVQDSTAQVVTSLAEQGVDDAAAFIAKKSVTFKIDPETNALLNSYHETYPKSEYDRKNNGPSLLMFNRSKKAKASILKEVSDYKKSEMEVHPQSLNSGP